jgi:hypothetical protein
VLAKQPVMRLDEDAQTGAVEERHLRQVELNDPATTALLRSQNVSEVVPCGQVELANGADRRTQRIMIDNSQLVPGTRFGSDGLDDSHDDAP